MRAPTYFSSWLLVLTLSLLLVGVRILSHRFSYTADWQTYPTNWMVALMLSAGFSYLALCRTIQISVQINRHTLLILVMVGLMLRLMFIGSVPILEDDFYRYFFDGQLVNAGLNPYIYPPQQALTQLPIPGIELLGGSATSEPPHPDLMFLNEHPFVARVAYPQISTIYPPVCQAFFALSQWLTPFSLDGWRVLLIIVDLVNLMLVTALLTHFNKPIIWASIYWLNPLLITETANAAHMDVLILPFLLSAVWCGLKQKTMSCAIFLSLAVGVKIWPILLAPIFLCYFLKRGALKTKAQLSVWITMFALCCLLILSPQLMLLLNETSGLVSYSQSWQTNSFIFYWLNALITYVWENDLISIADPSQLPRMISALILLVVVVYRAGFHNKNEYELLANLSLVTGVLFFLSPTGYPWYFIWLLPFLAVKPSFPLLLLTPLLALYDLRYSLEQTGEALIFQYVYVTLEFLPSLVLLIIFHRKNSKLKAAHS